MKIIHVTSLLIVALTSVCFAADPMDPPQGYRRGTEVIGGVIHRCTNKATVLVPQANGKVLEYFMPYGSSVNIYLDRYVTFIEWKCDNDKQKAHVELLQGGRFKELPFFNRVRVTRGDRNDRKLSFEFFLDAIVPGSPVIPNP